MCLAKAYAAGGDDDRAPRGGAAAEVGVGALGEDTFLNLNLKLGYTLEAPAVGCEEADGDCRSDLRLAAQAPLRLRMIDSSPADDSLLRERDWDETADFFRIARLIEYGEPADTLHARAGELGPISLGHGTIVDDYYNVISVDHYQPGVYGEANTRYGGAEALVNNAVSPSVMGARGYVRPYSFVDDDHLLSRLAVGASLVADVSAPGRLAAETDQPESVVDRTYRPVVDEETATSLWGVDLEMPIVESDRFDAVSYADLNGHTSLGQGLHAGAFGHLEPNDELELSARLEYRRVGQHYLPEYVGPTYEVDRYQYLGWGRELPAPKARATASLDAAAAHGYAGSLGARMEDTFDASVRYADHEGPGNATFGLKATGHPVENVQLGLYYYKQHFDEFGEVFEPEGSLAVGEARANVYGPIFGLASYGRLWRVDSDANYRAVDEWNVGMGVSQRF